MDPDESLRRDQLVLIRPVTKSDLAYVARTWLHSLRYGNDIFREIPEETYNAQYSAIISAVIERKTTLITIACLREEPGLILGFSIATMPDTLHYVYVKEPWRKLGIARDIVPGETKYVTHVTFPGMAIKRKKNLIFDPFKL